MKRIIFLIAILLHFIAVNAQTIPANFFGENAWMPDSVGNCGSCHYGGKLDSNWANVAQSNVKFIRFGGAAADNNIPTITQYLKIIDSVRMKGMEPVIQLPYHHGDYDTNDIRPLLTSINIVHNRKIRYWIIGNEPDLYTVGGYNKSATKIAAYIKRYAIAMKKVDPTIKIIGPELSRMSVDVNDTLYKIVDTLTRFSGPDTVKSIVGMIPSGNGAASGKPYIDYFSYHMYNYDGATTTEPRSWVISRLTAAGKDSARMGWLKRRLDLCNSTIPGRSSYPIKPVITEANICSQGNGTTPLAGDNFAGTKASSFIAGQHWCEMMSLGIYQGIEWINFWSSMEGNGGGYMVNQKNGAKKSTYYHMQQMGKWFNGTHYIGTHSSGNLKVFGSSNSAYIAVMILNQDTLGTAAKKYTIRLDGTTPGHTTHWVSLGIDAFSTNYVDTIQPSSTTLLVFDCAGNIAQKYRYEQNDSLHPFKSVWAASSPATILTVSAGPDKANGSCCNTQLVALANITSGTTYEWFEEGAGSNFSTNDTTVVNPTNTTTYKVLAHKGGCTATDYVTVNIGGETDCPANCDEGEGRPRLMAPGKNEHINAQLLNNVPNPFEHKTVIRYRLGTDCSKAEIRICDLSGGTRMTQELKTESSSTEIDCSSLEQGLYFYSLWINDRRVETKKMMIVK